MGRRAWRGVLFNIFERLLQTLPLFIYRFNPYYSFIDFAKRGTPAVAGSEPENERSTS
jgi:hypothetical protein